MGSDPGRCAGGAALLSVLDVPGADQTVEVGADRCDGPGEVAEAVDRNWEGEHGHAVASVRYGAISWPRASDPPEDEPPDDPRAAFLWMIERREETELAEPWNDRRGRYVW